MRRTATFPLQPQYIYTVCKKIHLTMDHKVAEAATLEFLLTHRRQGGLALLTHLPSFFKLPRGSTRVGLHEVFLPRLLGLAIVRAPLLGLSFCLWLRRSLRSCGLFLHTCSRLLPCRLGCSLTLGRSLCLWLRLLDLFSASSWTPQAPAATLASRLLSSLALSTVEPASWPATHQPNELSPRPLKLADPRKTRYKASMSRAP